MVDVPRVVRAKAAEADALPWLDGIDDLVNDLASRWQLTVGATMSGGTEALVLAVTLADDRPAVLKLIVPRRSAALHEITVLRHAGGVGCAALLADDVEHGAMLLERLGPSLFDLGVPFEQRLDVLTAVARAIWRPANDLGLPTGADKARWLAVEIARLWEERDRPCSERAVDDVLACAARREGAHDDERAVLVHGDVHQWNALQTIDRSGYKLVDPDGLHAEAEYDLGIMMREDPLELIAGDPWERANRLAAATGLDAVAVWEWGVVERVSTGLLCLGIGLDKEGREMLSAADAVSR